MEKIVEIVYEGVKENIEYETVIQKVLDACFEKEGLETSNLYISVTLTNPENIRKINQKFRNIDQETDVLSFPVFEKEEIASAKKIPHEATLGDIVISIDRVKEQAITYGHSFERELAYMVVHGFYHLMGEDHIKEEDRKVMREKEEKILTTLQIVR